MASNTDDLWALPGSRTSCRAGSGSGSRSFSPGRPSSPEGWPLGHRWSRCWWSPLSSAHLQEKNQSITHVLDDATSGFYPQVSGSTGLTGTHCDAILLGSIGVESEVELPSEQTSVVCVDQLEHALMDDVRLKTDKQTITSSNKLQITVN